MKSKLNIAVKWLALASILPANLFAASLEFVDGGVTLTALNNEAVAVAVDNNNIIVAADNGLNEFSVPATIKPLHQTANVAVLQMAEAGKLQAWLKNGAIILNATKPNGATKLNITSDNALAGTVMEFVDGVALTTPAAGKMFEIKLADESKNYVIATSQLMQQVWPNGAVLSGNGAVLPAFIGSVVSVNKSLKNNRLVNISEVMAERQQAALQAAVQQQLAAPKIAEPSVAQRLVESFKEMLKGEETPTKTVSLDTAVELADAAVGSVRELNLPEHIQKRLQAKFDDLDKQKVMPLPSPNAYVQPLAISEGDLDQWHKIQQQRKRADGKYLTDGSAGTLSALPENEVFLPKLGKADGGYYEQSRKALARLAVTKGDGEKDVARLRMAQVALIYNRPHEALAWLNYMSKNKQGLPQNEQGQFLYGVTLSTLGRNAEALPVLENSKTSPLHRSVWLANVYANTNNDDRALQLFDKFVNVSNSYPSYMRTQIRLSEANSLFRTERYKDLETRMRQLSTVTENGQVPPQGLLLLAHAALKQKETVLGENLLAQVAEGNDPKSANQAKYDFVKHLEKAGEMSAQATSEHLEALRMVWRGDEVERDALYDLGNYYLGKNDYRNGLERLKYYATYFPDAPRKAEVAATMAQHFNHFFDNPEARKDMDKLAYLGMYYDFRELTPAGKRGDDIILEIGQELRQLGLFERAAKLFKYQLEFRTQSATKKAELGKVLAELYLLDHSPELAIESLDNTQVAGLNQNLQNQRDLLRAKALSDLGEYDEARTLAAALGGAEAKELEADIVWGDENYKELEQLVDMPTGGKWDDKQATAFMRRVFAAHQLKDSRFLFDAAQKYKNNIIEAGLADDFSFLTQDLGLGNAAVVKGQGTDLQKAVNQMASYNQFVQEYEQFRSDRADEKKMRRYYNYRMGQASGTRPKD